VATRSIGFEDFVNLESLWINGNKLKKLNNLDAQKRLKVLYAQVSSRGPVVVRSMGFRWVGA
jgi:hypothetical protein